MYLISAGKSMCDRMTAVLKSHARTYLNQANNVSTAEELYKALTYRGGVRDCSVALVSFKQPKDKEKEEKIKNITLLRNFSFQNNCLTTQKAYGMGIEQVIKFSDIKKVPTPTSLTVMHDFKPVEIRRTYHAPSAARSSRTPVCFEEDEEVDLASHSCMECDKTFRRYRDLLAHEAAGNHKSARMSTKPLSDHLLEYYQERYTNMQFTVQETRDFVMQEMAADMPKTPAMLDKQSWALPKPVARKRYTEGVHKFLRDQQTKGGGKADPVKVAAAMALQFMRSDRLSETQIRAYYSVLKSRQQRMERIEEPVDEEETEIELREEGERGELEEKNRLLSHVNDLLSSNHPIMYHEENLCNVSENFWKQQKKPALTAIAKDLRIPIKSDATILILLKAINEKLSTCACK